MSGDLDWRRIAEVVIAIVIGGVIVEGGRWLLARKKGSRP